MIPGLNPKKMQAVMKQLGMSQEDIDAKRVIIEKSNGDNIIIDNPSVAKVKMQGQETFQISGDISEESSEETTESENEEGEEETNEADIKMIQDKTNANKEKIIQILKDNNGDIAKTILDLS